MLSNRQSRESTAASRRLAEDLDIDREDRKGQAAGGQNDEGAAITRAAFRLLKRVNVAFLIICIATARPTGPAFSSQSSAAESRANSKDGPKRQPPRARDDIAEAAAEYGGTPPESKLKPPNPSTEPPQPPVKRPSMEDCGVPIRRASLFEGFGGVSGGRVYASSPEELR